MADPFTWVAIIGAAVGAYGTVQAGKAADAQAQSAQLQADQNAELSEANAAAANLQASAQEEQSRRESRRRLAAMRGAIAESGTGLNGSNADIYSQSARAAELDALNIRYGGLLESKGLMNQASGYRTSGQSALAEGRAARQGANLRAGTNLLTTGAGIYQNMNKPSSKG